MGWRQVNARNILYVIIIVFTPFRVANLVKRLVMGLGKSHEALDETLFHFLGSIARYAVLVFAGLIVLDRFGIQTTSLIAIPGAAGLAVSLAPCPALRPGSPTIPTTRCGAWI